MADQEPLIPPPGPNEAPPAYSPPAGAVAQSQQGYPAGGVSQQGYPAGGVSQQGYPAGGVSQQGYPAGAASQQGYPAGAVPPGGTPKYPPGVLPQFWTVQVYELIMVKLILILCGITVYICEYYKTLYIRAPFISLIGKLELFAPLNFR